MWKKIFQQRMSEKNELETLREQLENLKEQARAFTIIVKISIRISIRKKLFLANPSV